MLQEDFRVAIDIGTTKVCTIIAQKRPDHRINVTGISVVPVSYTHLTLPTNREV